MLMSDSHYGRTVTTSTPRIHPSPHKGCTSQQKRRPYCRVGLSILFSTGGYRRVEGDSRRRSRQDDSAGKEVDGEDKAKGEKVMSHKY
ncbi:hypothetical protein PoB_000113900 [Plakobranchus ocellatus]|uniref:Uncharacterized protein n=1 Tax=Plakobranchus ocellatus TaxID=259542 RepID=A0AAV3XXZ4_9GAST|nr:hypothetical protein PoB_000113900 [Plakobranchus ocellatus]